MNEPDPIGEHAQDVLQRVAAWQRSGEPCALIVITRIEGGGVRAPGALMGVSEIDKIGYISGGCVDSDAILQARDAIRSGTPRAIRYGAGSPFVDLPLPCGGAIEILVLPNPDASIIQRAADQLSNRCPIALTATENGALGINTAAEQPTENTHSFRYFPKLRVRLAGRGSDVLALAKLANAGGYAVELQLVDDDDIAAATGFGFEDVTKLQTPSALPPMSDDAWTAFVLMFHERDWEVPLLAQALSGQAFYIGAVGSRRTHQTRCVTLQDSGVALTDIARIQAPIGLVPSLRDSSMVAISALAEIIQAFQETTMSKPHKTALLLLAAGQSSRFENGDKLLADLDGQPVLARTAALQAELGILAAVAVVSPEQDARAELLSRSGWTVETAPLAHKGQAHSLAAGIAYLERQSDVDQVIVLLGDMPFVPADHIQNLIDTTASKDVCAAMTEADGVLCPPALFKRDQFEALKRLTGDAGARSVFQTLSQTRTVKLPDHLAMDIDRVEDLKRAEGLEHA